MLVSVTSFGSLWRYRFSKDQKDQDRFAWGVYYNTTGVRVAGEIRQRPKIVGYARFHQCSGFDPHYPARIMGLTRPEQTGRLQIGNAGWRCPDTWLISFSECRQDQEAMFLMSAESWIATELGRFVLTPYRDRPWLASLVLTTTRTGVNACGI